MIELTGAKKSPSNRDLKGRWAKVKMGEEVQDQPLSVGEKHTSPSERMSLIAVVLEAGFHGFGKRKAVFQTVEEIFKQTGYVLRPDDLNDAIKTGVKKTWFFRDGKRGDSTLKLVWNGSKHAKAWIEKNSDHPWFLILQKMISESVDKTTVEWTPKSVFELVEKLADESKDEPVVEPVEGQTLLSRLFGAREIREATFWILWVFREKGCPNPIWHRILKQLSRFSKEELESEYSGGSRIFDNRVNNSLTTLRRNGLIYSGLTGLIKPTPKGLPICEAVYKKGLRFGSWMNSGWKEVLREVELKYAPLPDQAYDPEYDDGSSTSVEDEPDTFLDQVAATDVQEDVTKKVNAWDELVVQLREFQKAIVSRDEEIDRLRREITRLNGEMANRNSPPQEVIEAIAALKGTLIRH